ncbi:hypothetical protein [Gordonia paraffinivorans]|uniref:hypothetical protein n=1 Tax=Gordonia paraffinivorans TaxID=175628 RepID=UPI0014480B37|nr:hypothetical protein [Gordonia paraffinivorans]
MSESVDRSTHDAAEYARQCELLRDTYKEIRVLCPRGHFIAHVAVYFHSDMNGLWIHPRGRGGEYGPHFNAPGVHGLDLELRAVPNTLRIRARCTKKKCRYNGAFNFAVLALRLAQAATSGHAEYRVTG